MNAKNSPNFMNVIAAIATERQHQRQLFLKGRIKFDCASPIVDNDRKLRVLVEEVGEVAQGIDFIERAGNNKRLIKNAPDNLREELVQIAAVCVAWLESLECADIRKET